MAVEKQKGRQRSLKVHASNPVRKKLRNRQGRICHRRKRHTMMREEALSRAKYMVLNKSDVDISEECLILLSRGLNFIPTPKWSKEVYDCELHNLVEHKRRMKWAHIFGKKWKWINLITSKTKNLKNFQTTQRSSKWRIIEYEEMANVKLCHLSEAAKTDYL